jgi:hypothetical protein
MLHEHMRHLDPKWLLTKTVSSSSGKDGMALGFAPVPKTSMRSIESESPRPIAGSDCPDGEGDRPLPIIEKHEDLSSVRSASHKCPLHSPIDHLSHAEWHKEGAMDAG